MPNKSCKMSVHTAWKYWVCGKLGEGRKALLKDDEIFGLSNIKDYNTSEDAHYNSEDDQNTWVIVVKVGYKLLFVW